MAPEGIPYQPAAPQPGPAACAPLHQWSYSQTWKLLWQLLAPLEQDAAEWPPPDAHNLV